MNDTEKTMEHCARDFKRTLEERLERIERVREMTERADGRFGLQEELERLQDEWADPPYGVSSKIIMNVELYGGGPAGGVEFTCEKGRHGLEWVAARLWHQDWYQSKGYVELDVDLAQQMWDAWGLEYFDA